MSNEATSTTIEKVRRYNRAIRQLNAARREVRSIETELANASNDLGKWLVPSDAPEGDTFNVWIGDGILSVKRGRGSEIFSDYEVKWIKEVSAKAAVDMAIT